MRVCSRKSIIAFSFVVWGLLHGVALSAHRLYSGMRRGADPAYQLSARLIPTVLSIAAMQYWVLLTWIVFRVRDFEQMRIATRKFVLFDFDLSLAGLGLGSMAMFSTVLLMVAFAALHLFSHSVGRIDNWAGRASLPLAAVICAVLGFLAYCLWPLSVAPFIYFQF